MPRGGRIGPPHVTRSRESFSALDMFNQLTSFTSIVQTRDARISATGDDRISETGNVRISAAQA